MKNPANQEFPLHALIKNRWSPRHFEERPIDVAKLSSLFEAARWAPSSFNEQPWAFVSASRHLDPDGFDAFAACLSPANEAWAKLAPMLIFAVAKLHFDKNQKLNPHAWYDTGQAVAYLTLQAEDLGISVHQMAGFDSCKASELLKLPPTHQLICAIALGNSVRPGELSDEARLKESAPRIRKPQAGFVHRLCFSP